MLAKLLSRLHGREIHAGVVSLLGRGPVSADIEALGVPVWHLNMKALLGLPLAAANLARVARNHKPDLIQGWMYHGNLAALVGRSFANRRPRLVWGIRQSLYDVAWEKRGTQLVIHLGARLSGHADAILYNSETARRQHEGFGYAASRALVIDNGFDADHFCPDLNAYRAVRQELGLAPEAIIVGLIARFHPVKGHDVFLRAAGMLAERLPLVHFLLVGRGVTAENRSLAALLNSPGLGGRVHLLGERLDIHRLTASLDVASSSSWAEGFPNTLGEAMSCAIPCVATDVGDVKRVLDNTGFVVPVGDAGALAKAWERLLTMPEDARRTLGKAARARVMECYSLDRVAAVYGALYRDKLC